MHMLMAGGRDGVVGTDLVRAGQSGDEILVWAQCFVPVQTGPVAQPATYTVVFPGGKVASAWC
jgi:hypothetical protein